MHANSSGSWLVAPQPTTHLSICLKNFDDSCSCTCISCIVFSPAARSILTTTCTLSAPSQQPLLISRSRHGDSSADLETSIIIRLAAGSWQRASAARFRTTNNKPSGKERFPEIASTCKSSPAAAASAADALSPFRTLATTARLDSNLTPSGQPDAHPQLPQQPTILSVHEQESAQGLSQSALTLALPHRLNTTIFPLAIFRTLGTCRLHRVSRLASPLSVCPSFHCWPDATKTSPPGPPVPCSTDPSFFHPSTLTKPSLIQASPLGPTHFIEHPS